MRSLLHRHLKNLIFYFFLSYDYPIYNHTTFNMSEQQSSDAVAQQPPHPTSSSDLDSSSDLAKTSHDTQIADSTQFPGSTKTSHDTQIPDSSKTSQNTQIIESFNYDARIRFEQSGQSQLAQCREACSRAFQKINIPLKFTSCSGFTDGFDAPVAPSAEDLPGCLNYMKGLIVVVEIDPKPENHPEEVKETRFYSWYVGEHKISKPLDAEGRFMPFIVLDASIPSMNLNLVLVPYSFKSKIASFVKEQASPGDLSKKPPYAFWSLAHKLIVACRECPSSVKPRASQAWKELSAPGVVVRQHLQPNIGFLAAPAAAQQALFKAIHVHTYVGPDDLEGLFVSPPAATAGSPEQGHRQRRKSQKKGADSGHKESKAGPAGVDSSAPAKKKAKPLHHLYSDVSKQYNIQLKKAQKSVSQHDVMEYQLMNPWSVSKDKAIVEHVFLEMIQTLEPESSDKAQLLKSLALFRLEELSTCDQNVIFGDPSKIIASHRDKAVLMKCLKSRKVKEYDEGEWAKTVFDTFHGDRLLINKFFYTPAFQKFMDNLLDEHSKRVTEAMMSDAPPALDADHVLQVVFSTLYPEPGPVPVPAQPEHTAVGALESAGANAGEEQGEGPAVEKEEGERPATPATPPAPPSDQQQSGKDKKIYIKSELWTFFVVYFHCEEEFAFPQFKREIEVFMALCADIQTRYMLLTSMHMDLFRAMLHATEDCEDRASAEASPFGQVMSMMVREFCRGDVFFTEESQSALLEAKADREKKLAQAGRKRKGASKK